MMVELQTFEHVIHFMKSGKLRLSRYDNRFIQNLETIVHKNNTVTTNQVMLLEKIVTKYYRQLSKFGYDVNQLIQLPWKAKIIQSHTDFTDAYISIINNRIIFKSPFNKNFLNEFRKHKPNAFIWDKESKCHYSDYGTYNFKLVSTLANEFFDKVHYCKISQFLLDVINSYSNLIFDPTLVQSNGYYYIAGVNQYLHSQIKDIILNDDLETLAKLSNYGVIISDNIVQNNIAKKIASQYTTSIDIVDNINLVPIIEAMKVDAVFISGSTTLGLTAYINDLKKNIERIGIDCFTGFEKYFNKDFSSYKFPLSIRFRNTASIYEPNHIKKIIRIVNSQPITIQ